MRNQGFTICEEGGGREEEEPWIGRLVEREG